MNIKKILAPVLCGVLAVSCALLPLATFQTSADYDGGYDEDVLQNPFGGGVFNMEYAVGSDDNAYKTTYDIPNTYGYGSFSNVNYRIGDALIINEDTAVGNITLNLLPDVGYATDIDITYVNKLFDVGSMVANNAPLIAVPDYMPAVTITVRANFIVPVENRELDLWGNASDDWFVRYEETFTLTERQILTYQNTYGYTLSLYGLFYNVLTTYPELENESELLLCSTMRLSFNNITNLTKVYLLNQTNDDYTTPLPYENQFENNPLRIFTDELYGSGGSGSGGGSGETPAPVEPDTIDTLLAVPVAFLETEFLPNFSFGDLLLILLGFVLFSFALKIGFGG